MAEPLWMEITNMDVSLNQNSDGNIMTTMAGTRKGCIMEGMYGLGVGGRRPPSSSRLASMSSSSLVSALLSSAPANWEKAPSLGVQRKETYRERASAYRAKWRKAKEEERKELERKETERKEMGRMETERKESERKETDRKEIYRSERKEVERKAYRAKWRMAMKEEKERKESERKEMERKEMEKEETERKEIESERMEEALARFMGEGEMERMEIKWEETERKEKERKDTERKELERKEMERKETEGKEMEAARKDMERKETKRKERKKTLEGMERDGRTSRFVGTGDSHSLKMRNSELVTQLLEAKEEIARLKGVIKRMSPNRRVIGGGHEWRDPSPPPLPSRRWRGLSFPPLPSGKCPKDEASDRMFSEVQAPPPMVNRGSVGVETDREVLKGGRLQDGAMFCLDTEWRLVVGRRRWREPPLPPLPDTVSRKRLKVGATTLARSSSGMDFGMVGEGHKWRDLPLPPLPIPVREPILVRAASCPVKRRELRVTGFDVSVSVEEITRVLSGLGGCPISDVKTGPVRALSSGLGVILVRLPMVAAYKLVDIELIRLGWTMARVELLKTRPLQCYRCWRYGHTQYRCYSVVDRRDACFKCGQSGHMVSACRNKAYCVICHEAGREATHRLGGPLCVASGELKVGIGKEEVRKGRSSERKEFGKEGVWKGRSSERKDYERKEFGMEEGDGKEGDGKEGVCKGRSFGKEGVRKAFHRLGEPLCAAQEPHRELQ